MLYYIGKIIVRNMRKFKITERIWSMNGLLKAVPMDFADYFVAFMTFARETIAEIKVSDMIDILLLTILFSFIFRYIIHKKAGALIVGVFLCFAIYMLASVFELTGIRYILAEIFQIGIIAIIIIFQPEIRELLERLGSGSINSLKGLGDSGSQSKMQYRSIDAICKAVHILSMQKTGALIVIARNMNLDEIIHTGTEINADISEPLIRNLFYDKSPLHDGAVVIDNGEIAAAACILPLTKRNSVDQELGTRHRAAIGLSESTDAMVVVVSEETGIVSVAKDAELTRNYTNESLRQLLIKELIKGDQN